MKRRCGPCKMIYPELCEMAKEYAEAGVEIVKFECNKANKELGMKVGRQPRFECVGSEPAY